MRRARKSAPERVVIAGTDREFPIDQKTGVEHVDERLVEIAHRRFISGVTGSIGRRWTYSAAIDPAAGNPVPLHADERI